MANAAHINVCTIGATAGAGLLEAVPDAAVSCAMLDHVDSVMRVHYESVK